MLPGALYVVAVQGPPAHNSNNDWPVPCVLMGAAVRSSAVVGRLSSCQQAVVRVCCWGGGGTSTCKGRRHDKEPSVAYRTPADSQVPGDRLDQHLQGKDSSTLAAGGILSRKHRLRLLQSCRGVAMNAAAAPLSGSVCRQYGVRVSRPAEGIWKGGGELGRSSVCIRVGS